MIQELKKLKNTHYGWMSFLILGIAPLLCLFLWTIDVFRPGVETLNKINLFLLGSFHGKVVFPILALLTFRIDRGLEGVKRAYYLPIKKSKIIYQKVLFTYVWVIALFAFSLLINTIVHWSIFNDWLFFQQFLKSWKSYLLVFLLGITMVNLAYTLFIMFDNYLLTLLLLLSSMLLGFTLQSKGHYFFIIYSISKGVLNTSGHKTELLINLGLMCLVSLMMIYKIKTLFKKIEKE